MAVDRIIESRMHNTTRCGQSIQMVADIVQRFGGRYLVRGGKIVPLREEGAHTRAILLEGFLKGKSEVGR